MDVSMVRAYVQIGLYSLFPVAVSIIICLLQKHGKLNNLSYWKQQIIIGIIFGALAILGTETAFPFTDQKVGITALLNLRDAPPLIAGFIFGGPSGIIAGFIGGIERFFATYWGAGEYTQIACSLSTAFSGVFAALIRKFITKGKRPSWGLALFYGAVMESIHMISVFITHLNDPGKSIGIIKVCTFPMVIGVATSVCLSVVFANLIFSTRIKDSKINIVKKKKSLIEKIQVWLIFAVVISYLLSTIFTVFVQAGNSESYYKTLLESNIVDTEADLSQETNKAVLSVTQQVTSAIESFVPEELNEVSQDDMYDYLMDLSKEKNVAEINIVGKDNKIKASTDEKTIGFDLTTSTLSTPITSINSKGYEYFIDSSRRNAAYPNDTTKQFKYAGCKLKDGFVEIGLNEHQLKKLTSSSIKDLTANRHVGETGYVMILTTDWVIVSDESSHYEPGKGKVDFAQVLDMDPNATKEGEMYEGTLYGQQTYGMYRLTKSVSGYMVVSCISKEEVNETTINNIYISFVSQIIIFGVLLALIYITLDKLVLKKLSTVNQKLTNISQGNLQTKLEDNSSLEFEELSSHINSTVDTLKSYIKEAEERIDKELEFARDIQISSLPAVFPAYPNIDTFDIYATMHTAKEVGGDFYDFYMLGESRLCFLIADVSGKGIPAALFMMQSKTMIKNLIETGIDLGKAITKANNELCEHNNARMFVTGFICILDLSSGIITYVNAGHNKPLVYRKNNTFEYIDSPPSLIMAGMSGIKYKTHELKLNPGDKLFLYTDGVTEANNTEGKMYSEERLNRKLNEISNLSLSDIHKEIKKDIDVFANGAEQFDDITMLSVEYKGDQNENKYIDHIEVLADDSSLETLFDFVENNMEKMNAPMKYLSQLKIVVEEIFVNISHYAYRARGIQGQAWIDFIYYKDRNMLVLKFIDEGLPFDPLAKEDPDITLAAEDRQIGGLGIFMAKNIMDDIKYEHVNGENILTLRKTLKDKPKEIK